MERFAAGGFLFEECIEFIAQGGGPFEFEIGGSAEHFLFDRFDGAVAIVFGGRLVCEELFFEGSGDGSDGGFLAERAANGVWRNAVFQVKSALARASSLGDADHFVDGIGPAIGIENDASAFVPGGTAGGLDERRCGTQEPLLVCVQDGDKSDLGQIEAFA